MTLSLSNASGAPPNSWFAVFVFESGADPNTREGLVAVNYSEISDGAVSGLVLKEPVEGDWEPSEETWIATGGEPYVRYVYITTDPYLDYDTTSRVTVQHPDTFSVDGDFTEEFDYVEDLVDAPTLTVGVSDADKGTNDEGLTIFSAAVATTVGQRLAVIEDWSRDLDDGSGSAIMKEFEMVNGAETLHGTWLYEPDKPYLIVFMVTADKLNAGPESVGSYTLWTEFDPSDGHETVSVGFVVDDVVDENFDFTTSVPDTWYGPFK